MKQSQNSIEEGNDGDYNTRWCASSGSAEQWWMVDLGLKYSIQKIKIMFEFESNYRYYIETSDNTKKWTTIVDQRKNEKNSQFREHIVDARGRYVRIQFTGLASGCWASFYEFEVFTEGTNDVEETKLNNKIDDYNLYQNYPNPFNPITKIKFCIKKTEPVKLFIYDIIGRKINTLVNTSLQKGFHSIKWDGKASDGIPVSDGVYFYTIRTTSFSKTRKMLLLK